MRAVALVLSRVLDLTFIALSIALLFIIEIQYLLLWDVLAVVHVAIRIRRIRRSHRNPKQDWLRTLMPARLGFPFTLAISLFGIGAGLAIVLAERIGLDQDGTIPSAAAVPLVLLAWAILHFGYAERYAHTYYATLPEKVLRFPEQDRPTFGDFAYFSFTVGVSFAVSDIETRTTRIRSQVLGHSILSFIYNTATLGIAIGVITGK